MSVFQSKKIHFNDTVSKKLGLENTSNLTDVQLVKNWIKKTLNEEKHRSLSKEKRDKIYLLWSSLKENSGSNTEVSDLNLDCSSQKNATSDTENDDSKKLFDFLEQHVSKHDDVPQKIKNKKTQDILVPQSTSKSHPPSGVISQDNDLDVFYSDMAKLSKSIAELCRIMSTSGMKRSHFHLEKLLSNMENIAKDYSLKNVKNNWEDALQYFKKLDLQNLHEKINTLSCQMNVIQSTFDKKNSESTNPTVDQKLLSIVNNTHNLLSLLKLLNEKISTKEVLSLDTKLSEIKNSVENNGKYTEYYTKKFVRKFEDRLDNIGSKVQNIHKDVLDQKKPTKQKLESVEILDQRLKNLEAHVKNIILKLEKKQNTPESQTIIRNLEGQISHIKDLIANNSKDQKTSQEFDQHVFRLEDYIVKTAYKTARSMLNSIDRNQNIEQIIKNNMQEYCKEIQKVYAEQTIKNFTTLYDMLVKIFQKLENPIEAQNPSISSSLSPDYHGPEESTASFQDPFHVKKFDKISGTNQNGIQSDKLSTQSFIQDTQSPTFSLNNSLDSTQNGLHGISEQNDPGCDKEKELNITNDIQQILERVSLIQHGILEDDNKIPDYISAARRAASASIMRNDMLKKTTYTEKSTTQRWNFIKRITPRGWYASIMLAIALLVSSLLLSPALIRSTFVF
ncbi:hypothetical protein [Candidatus Liberibacter africanus]|uniref:Putative peptidoglycan binding protein n=1 Tax=Candidatus Liberibacter africanus PTSAPSY TaxID=1277257 RepID=A0A0G3I8V6_LIBAF|nr:hypothetical protein [Candidatus Liberibacter africanus]AKK20192.1 putative peptidoglycan binding protein [Candidatus Liberibacter africanus PTSAPSY]